VLGLVAGLAAVVVVFLPTAVLQRWNFTSQERYHKQETRTRLYSAALENVPQYGLLGVGAGNYYQDWGIEHGFGKKREIAGPHNCYFAVTIYWGFLGLTFFLAFLWMAYRALPRTHHADGLEVALVCVALSLLLWTLAIHGLYDKQFSLGLGLIVGSRCWVHPRLRLHPSNATSQGAPRTPPAAGAVEVHQTRIFPGGGVKKTSRGDADASNSPFRRQP
jgi:hypothetical protein